ncbi:MAG: FHA domain-containing protein [Deltaproteobacteria bacterium]|nr:FHA domain-containing protein [Deltaproteobacteria bacterium]
MGAIDIEGLMDGDEPGAEPGDETSDTEPSSGILGAGSSGVVSDGECPGSDTDHEILGWEDDEFGADVGDPDAQILGADADDGVLEGDRAEVGSDRGLLDADCDDAILGADADSSAQSEVDEHELRSRFDDHADAKPLDEPQPFPYEMVVEDDEHDDYETAVPSVVEDEDTDPIDLIDSATPYLRILDDGGRQRWFPLGDVSVVVGRSEMADLVVRGRGVAVFHARIAPAGEGYRVVDLDARSGTALNGAPVEEALLEPGDRLRLGDLEVEFCRGLPRTHPVTAGRSMRELVPTRLPMETAMELPSTVRQLQRRSAQPLVRPEPTTPAVREPRTLVRSEVAEDPDLADRIAALVAHLRRHARLVAALTVMGLVFGVASYRMFPPAVSAHFELGLVQAASDNPVEPTTRRTLTFFRSARDNFLGTELVGRTLSQLGDPQVDALKVERVLQSLDFERVSQFTYRGSYETANDTGATEFLEAHLALFLETEVDKAIRVLTAEVDTLQEQLDRTERELSSVEAALVAFKVDIGEASPEHMPAIQRQLLELQSDQRREAQLVSRAQAEVDIARKRLASSDREIEIRVADARPYSEEIASTQRELIAARAAGKGMEHPHIKTLENRLSGLQQRHDKVLDKGAGHVKRRANPGFLRAKLALDEAKSLRQVAAGDVSRTEREVDRLEHVLRELPEREAELSGLTRRQHGLQTQHGELLVRLGHSQIQLALERRQVEARFDLITPPTVDTVSDEGILLARAGIGTLAGLLFALMLAWASDLRIRVRERLATQV